MKILAVVVCLVAVTYVHCDPDIDDLIANLVNNVDSNGDGVIDIEEAGNNLGLLIDTNVDGRITRSEFMAYWPETYGDSLRTTRQLFNRIDVWPIRRRGNNRLDDFDLLYHMIQLRVGVDLKISVDNLAAWVHKFHPNGNANRS